MKTLKIIATLMLLAAGVYSTLAQEPRGLRRGGNFGRFPANAARSGASVNELNRASLVPDTPDSLGKLDPTFGTGGTVITSLPNDDFSSLVKILPNGKIVVYDEDDSYSYLLGYNPDGTLDTAFGNSNGLIKFPFADGLSLGDGGLNVAFDGKILASGQKCPPATSTNCDYAVFRFNADGKPDLTFGTNGSIAVPIGTGEDFGTAIIGQPDGKILVAGSTETASGNWAHGVIRLTQAGTLDPTFGTGGKLVFSVPAANGGYTYLFNNIVLQPDGKLLLAGNSTEYNGFGNTVFAVRVNTDGTLDQTFGAGGILNVSLGFANRVSGLSVQSDGKILFTSVNQAEDLSVSTTIARFQPNGANDTSFGMNGRVFIPRSQTNESFSADLIVQPNGKILVGGFSRSAGQQNRFAVLRLNADGTRDTAFGINGVITAALGVSSYITALELQPDGKLLALGDVAPVFTSEPYDFGLARFVLDAPAAPPFFDFDGDGRADVSVFRGGVWYRLNSSDNSFSGAQFGIASDKLVPADYDGDRRSDLAVFRDGVWYILNSQNNSFRAVQFGLAGDAPVPGDYDADGKADVAVFRAGIWYILNSANNSFRGEQFGQAGDKPIVGDFDADGKQDLTVFRSGVWYVNRSTAGFYAVQFGIDSDKPVAADYNGDGKTDVAVYRPSTGTWYTLLNPAISYSAVQFGQNGDAPVPADYDGDGRADRAVYRGGNWFLLTSANNLFRAVQFGQSGDAPVETAYLP